MWAIYKFLKNARGNLSITTSVVGLMLVTTVGAALDGGRLLSSRHSLQAITDAAALAAAMPKAVSVSEREEIARATIAAHTVNLSGYDNLSDTVEVRNFGKKVYVSLTGEVPLFFAAVLGSDTRRVSASSLAEESITSSMAALSFSFVFDLTSSMNGVLGHERKIDLTRAAVADLARRIETSLGGADAAKSMFSTGLYPFNWGMVENEAVPLEPGAETLLDALSFVSLGDGSVPTIAMENAVEDQLKGASLDPTQSRFIVYMTDGKVDEDKGDVRGLYLNERQMFENEDSEKCKKEAEKLLKKDAKLELDLIELTGTASSLNLDLNPEDFNLDIDQMEQDRLEAAMKSDKHAGHDHSDKVGKLKAKRIELREKFIEKCRPIQTVRVANACQKARDQKVSIIAVNLSEEDGIASNTIDMCVNGLSKDDKKDAAKGAEENAETRLKQLPSGLTVRLSADGTSYSADIRSRRDLSELLSSVIPDTESKRTVRLVN